MEKRDIEPNKLFDLAFCVVAVLATLIIPDNADYLPLVGMLIIAVNIRMVYIFRKASRLLLLIVIIFYINITIGVFDCILIPKGLFFINEAQMALRLSEDGVIYSKCIMLFSAVFLLFLGGDKKYTESTVQKGFRYSYNELPLEIRDAIRDRQNPLISYGLLAVSMFVTFTMFSGSASSGYVAAGSAVYEYCVFILILSWYYRDKTGKGRVVYNILFGVCCSVYIIQGLIGGDRSSSFLLMIVIFAYFARNINLKNTLLLVVLGIPFANLIAIYRNNAGNSFSQLISALISKGVAIFFSDTTSFSYYAGVTVVSFADKGYTGSKLVCFFRWVLSLIIGEDSELTGINNVNITTMAAKFEHNGGGGIFPSTFYFFGGYIGVILSAIVLALIIRFFFAGKKPYHIITQYALIALSFRYYLYTSVPLFRGCLIILGLMYLACYLFNSVFIAKRKRADTAFRDEKDTT